MNIIDEQMKFNLYLSTLCNSRLSTATYVINHPDEFSDYCEVLMTENLEDVSIYSRCGIIAILKYYILAECKKSGNSIDVVSEVVDIACDNPVELVKAFRIANKTLGLAIDNELLDVFTGCGDNWLFDTPTTDQLRKLLNQLGKFVDDVVTETLYPEHCDFENLFRYADFKDDEDYEEIEDTVTELIEDAIDGGYIDCLDTKFSRFVRVEVMMEYLNGDLYFDVVPQVIRYYGFKLHSVMNAFLGIERPEIPRRCRCKMHNNL